MRIGVVTFPGTLDDGDAARAVRIAGGEAVPLWHGDADLHGVDAVVLPGGFSYGDYLRCGAIARFAPVMAEVIDAGARPACRCSGSATASRCSARRTCCPARWSATTTAFICRDQRLRVENTATAWTARYAAGPGDRRSR